MESTILGSVERGTDSSSSTCSSQPAASVVRRPVMKALLASVTCNAPADRFQSTQLSMVPKHRSRVHRGIVRVEKVGELGGRLVRGEPHPGPAQRQALLGRAPVLPADGVGDGLPVGAVPDHRGGSLRRHAERRYSGAPSSLFGGTRCLEHCLRQCDRVDLDHPLSD